MVRTRSIILGLAALAGMITLLVLWPCVRNGFTHWDDNEYLDRVVELRGFSLESIRWAFTRSVTVAGYYHPVTWLSHLIDYQLWGLRPSAHHATNLLLHILNTMLVALYVERLLRAVLFFTEGERLAAALAIAIVFGIHPLQVEVVAWIAERKTLLCTLFILAGLFAQLNLAERPQSRGWWWAMNGWFILALLSKPMAVSVPLAMLVLDWYPLRRHETLGWWRLLKEKLLILLFSALAATNTFLAQPSQGALDDFAHFGIMDRMLVAARSLVFYAWKILWPAWLSPYYPMDNEISVRSLEYVVPLAMCLIVIAAVVAFWRRLPSLGAVTIIYAMLILPISGVIPLGGFAMADRYAYLAMVPLIVLAATAAVWLWKRLGQLGRLTLTTLIACQILFYAHSTHAQIVVWRNDETLWRAVWSHFPNSAMANCQLAAALADQGQFEPASVFARRALELSPNSPEAQAIAGLIDLKLRRYDDAAKRLSEATQAKPTLVAARYNLACAYARLGRLTEAYEVLRELLVIQPEYAAFAVRDGELAALRNHPDYAARFGVLVGGAKKPAI